MGEERGKRKGGGREIKIKWNCGKQSGGLTAIIPNYNDYSKTYAKSQGYHK